MIEDFFHLPPVSTTPVVHLELQISPRIFDEFETPKMVYIQGLGVNWFMKKTRSRKSCDTVTLMYKIYTVVSYWNPKKNMVYGTFAGVDYNLTLCRLRVETNTWTMGNHMPESTLTLCQSRLYPPSQGLRIWPLYTLLSMGFAGLAILCILRQIYLVLFFSFFYTHYSHWYSSVTDAFNFILEYLRELLRTVDYVWLRHNICKHWLLFH